MALTQNGNVDRSGLPLALASRANRLGKPELILQLQEQAEAQMIAGGGQVDFLVSAGGNGKTGTVECRMDCVEMFQACDQALALYNTLKASCADPDGAAVSVTYADFSRLIR